MAISILRSFVFVNVALVASAAVLPRLAPGAQFITGACLSDANCRSGCCGFNTGKCVGPVVAQERDGGCGFGNSTPNNNAAQALQGPNAQAAPGVKVVAVSAIAPTANDVASAAVVATSAPPAIATSAAVAPGTLFITQACSSDADCRSSCCGFKSGKCVGPVVGQERDGGCGFGNATPNNIAAQKLQGPHAEAASGIPTAGATARRRSLQTLRVLADLD